MPRRKKGAGLNEHIENYIEEEGDFKPEKALRAVDLSFDKYCSVSKTLEKTSKINYSVYLNGEKI